MVTCCDIKDISVHLRCLVYYVLHCHLCSLVRNTLIMSNLLTKTILQIFNLPLDGSEGTNFKNETMCIDNTFHTIILPSLIKFHPIVLKKPLCKGSDKTLFFPISIFHYVAPRYPIWKMKQCALTTHSILLSYQAWWNSTH